MRRRSAVLPIAIALVVAGCVAGCATSPSGGIVTGSLPALPTPSLPSLGGLQPSTSTGAGATRPERVGSNLYRISTAGPRIDDRIQRENYALLRAAESTREVGATHFVVVNTGSRIETETTSLGSPADPGTLIRVFNLPPGEEPPIGAIQAAEIVQFFGPNFGRERTAAVPPR
jgi:hypothetical protein